MSSCVCRCLGDTVMDECASFTSCDGWCTDWNTILTQPLIAPFMPETGYRSQIGRAPAFRVGGWDFASHRSQTNDV